MAPESARGKRSDPAKKKREREGFFPPQLPLSARTSRHARVRPHRSILGDTPPPFSVYAQEDIGKFLEEQKAAVDGLLLSLTTMNR